VSKEQPGKTVITWKLSGTRPVSCSTDFEGGKKKETLCSDLALLGGKEIERGKPFPAWPQFDDSERRALNEGSREPRLVGALPEPRPWSSRASFGAHVHGARHGRGAVTNGTAALEVTMAALGVGPGDEVIVPDFTFRCDRKRSSVRQRGLPVLVDVDPETYCIDPPTSGGRHHSTYQGHYRGPTWGGHPGGSRSPYRKSASATKSALVEDSSHAHASEWRGQADMGAFGRGRNFQLPIEQS